MLKFLPVVLCTLFSSSLWALDIIQGKGASDALNHAKIQMFNNPDEPYEDDVLMLNPATGEVEKYYVLVYQDWNSPGADFVERVENRNVAAAERDLAITLSELPKKLDQISIEDTVIDGVFQQARCYFCGMKDPYLFTQIEAYMFRAKEMMVSDVQRIIDDIVKKSAGLILKSTIKAEMHVAVPFRSALGQALGMVVVELKIINGRVNGKIVEVRDHLDNKLYPLNNVDKIVVDSAEHMKVIVDFLQNAGYSFSSIPMYSGGGGGGAAGGRVTIIDCDPQKACEKSKE